MNSDKFSLVAHLDTTVSQVMASIYCATIMMAQYSISGLSYGGHYALFKVRKNFRETISDLWLRWGCALGQNGLMVSVLDEVNPEGSKSKDFSKLSIWQMTVLSIHSNATQPDIFFHFHMSSQRGCRGHSKQI